MILGQAGVGKHAALIHHVAEIKVGTLRTNFIDQGAAHGFDAIAHLAEFLFPLLTQLRRGEYHRHRLPAVRRRVGIVGADHALDLAEYFCGPFGVVGDNTESAHALAIQR